MSPKSIEELENKIFGDLPFKAKIEDIKWLIEYGKEQSERVQELEDRYNKVLGRALDFQEQNKRYHDAIKETLESFGLIEQQKYGKILEKALESVSHE